MVGVLIKQKFGIKFSAASVGLGGTTQKSILVMRHMFGLIITRESKFEVF